LNNGGLLPSAMALKDSLSQKPDTSPEPTMLTAYQQELLRQFENEIDQYLAQTIMFTGRASPSGLFQYIGFARS